MPGAINSGCGRASPNLAPDGTLYVLAYSDVGGSEVTARFPDGRLKPGWPYQPAGELSWSCLVDTDCPPYHVDPAFGPDGTLYLVVRHTDPNGPRLEVVALDPQGQLKQGWPYLLPIDPTDGEVASLTVAPDGRLFVRGDNLLVALDPDGRVSR